MARNDFETSEESGQPIQLFEFRFGENAGDVYRYTDGESVVTYDTNDYNPLAIDTLTSYEQRQDQEQNEMRYRVPLSSEVPELFRIYPPHQVVTILVRQGHIPNPDDPVGWASGENFPVAWRGRVLDVTREDNGAVILCEAGTARLTRPGLKRHFQYQCPHTFGKGRCGANRGTYEGTETVQLVNGNEVTVVGAGYIHPQATSNDYIRGTLEWDTPTGRQARHILRIENSGQRFVLSGPATDLSPTDTVHVFPGCKKTLEYCDDFHNAAPFFGGFPAIPYENPVGKNNHS